MIAMPGLIELAARRGTLIGLSVKLPSTVSAEIVASLGFDYVFVDQQHGVIDNAGLLGTMQAISAAGALPLTRVPENQWGMIGRALDFGARGVLVPLVETGAEAERAARASRYPPEGSRSYGGTLRAPFAMPPTGPTDPGRPACIVLVESARGIESVEEIAATPGVDGIMAGAHDLALSTGVPMTGDWLRHPTIEASLERLRTACQRNGILAGIGLGDGGAVGPWIERGYQMIQIGNDVDHLRKALARQLEVARDRLGS